MMPSAAQLRAVSMTENEYRRCRDMLGRAPNEVELGIFGALWSEHCGYKHSHALLKRLPSRSPRMLVGAGEENAGVVDIGEGLACVFKIESHNHPSAVEPFEGAATGVGGIIRDIFTMGARPVALLDSLRFGPLNSDRNRYLANGIIAGISHYGNCVGIPTVGGDTAVDECYAGNPLVNAMCVGLMRHDQLTRAVAAGVGNPLILVGTDTGRDGVHGATFASVEDPEQSARGVVQVGNPFMEKLLIEACLELLAGDSVVGLQDLGAAGLTSSSVEAAGRSGAGVRIDVAKVPRRTRGLSPYEVMLSESQERMLVIARRGRQGEVMDLFEGYGLHCAEIGQVTDDGYLTVSESERTVAHVPIRHLLDPPRYRYPVNRPRYLEEVQPLPNPSETASPDLVADLLQLLASPNIASSAPIWQTYDQTVGTQTVRSGGGDAAILAIAGSNRGLALATAGNSRQVYLDPHAGGALAVAAAARAVACAGAKPIAITNCLNFGSPTEPAVYFQLVRAIEGMADACNALDLVVTGGNVSLFNETEGRQIHPSPVIGMLGLIEDVDKAVTGSALRPGRALLLLGQQEGDLSASEYLAVCRDSVSGRPRIDLPLERRLCELILELAAAELLCAARCPYRGGLAVTAAEMAIEGGVGLLVDNLPPGDPETVLFGEPAGRVLISADPKLVEQIRKTAAAKGVPLLVLGHAQEPRHIEFGDLLKLDQDAAERAWKSGLANALAGRAK
ncbi:MAG: phosphoribosylformylglycinamidine synthase subunit PurL [Chloroflexi bacterium]|nr:phosphoribosylformylglycinamidine synthase subunit PurL [Chloroflexota bacterium]MXX67275.1 phosphoribosylformylglycinamidine synthase subunit PurL [Chloroflexota bacterium]MYB16485.1 phosphoribosylformylglycinamidine synthase subunit PurL [Chloroflexota bacterium]MYC47758.1 phosphoribosylformylglycinamidine synthase subunit PurL [Chloroflexota bacterium]